MDTNAVSGVALLLVLALGILLIPLQWVGAMVMAAAFHELCHYAALRSCGITVSGFGFGIGGVKLYMEDADPRNELICALAGPVGGLILLLFARIIPRTAVCAAAHSLFNLLPVYPLDGGRALRCGVQLVLPGPVGRAVCKIAEGACLFGIGVLGLYSCFALRLGLLPLAVSCSVLIRAFDGKRPCKAGQYSIQ